MSNANINCFNEAVLKILSTLYDTFPIPNDLNIQDLCQNMEHHKDVASIRSIFFETVNFLSNEGFIHQASRSERGGLVFVEVSLTSKALVRLHLAPASLQRTLIEEIRDSLKIKPWAKAVTVINRCALYLFRER